MELTLETAKELHAALARAIAAADEEEAERAESIEQQRRAKGAKTATRKLELVGT